VGTVPLQSGQTAYLAAGAVVRGQFVADGAENVTITGRGIIDGSTFDRWAQTTVPIDLRNCRNVSVDGITILDPAAWTLNLYKCSDVAVEGVNIIGARSNSDGITVQSCQRVAVRGCFVRGWDDNLVVKGYDGDARDISFTGCVLWTDLAQSCEVGYETRADVMENITFENITVLHANHKPVCSIHNSDSALVQNVTFRNITVEDCNLGQGDGAEFLLDLTTTKSQWSKTSERGNIRDVRFENITVLSGKVPAVRFFAINKDHTIDGVTIQNLTLMGRKVTGFDQLRYTFSPRKLGPDIVIKP
jgi:polygalacturonase